MKLCFLAGANSVHSYRWIKYFAEKGHQVHWISLTPLTVPTIEHASLYLPNKSFFYLLPGINIPMDIIRVKKLIKDIKPDLLHAHYAGINGLVAALSKFHPFVLTAWGSDVLFAGKSIVRGPLVKYALQTADLVTCDAEHMLNAMTKLGINKNKITIINFGVDTTRFSPDKRSWGIREKFGIDNKPIIVSMRTLEPVYNIETFITAASLVLNKHPEAQFLIVGRGPEESKLKEMAVSLNIDSNVKFISYLSNEELPEFVASTDIYVSTSLSDAGISASTAEAMASEIPVIITDTGENRKWVTDDLNGFIITIKNPEALAMKIIFLIEHKEIREKFGKEGRNIIHNRNSYINEMAKMEQLYTQLVTGYGKD